MIATIIMVVKYSNFSFQEITCILVKKAKSMPIQNTVVGKLEERSKILYHVTAFLEFHMKF